MSLSFTIVKRFKPLHGVRRGLVDITFDDTYIGGGWPVVPADLGLQAVQLRLPAGVNESGVMIAWNIGATPLSGGTISGVAGVGGAAITNQLNGLIVRAEFVGI